jgi:hypothetical protein
MRYRKGLTNPCRFCGRPTTGTLCGDHMTVMRPKEEVPELNRRLARGINYLNRFLGKYGSDRENQDFYQTHSTQFWNIHSELRRRN